MYFYSVPNGSRCLTAAYKLMKDVVQSRISVDNPDAFNQDLFVLAAELSLTVILTMLI